MMIRFNNASTGKVVDVLPDDIERMYPATTASTRLFLKSGENVVVLGSLKEVIDTVNKKRTRYYFYGDGF